MVTIARYTLLGYGVVLILGGIMGYAKGRSRVSLLTGSISGVVILGAFAWSLQSPTPALWLGAAMAAILAIGMGARFRKSGKFMPAGMIALLSLVALAVMLAGVFAVGTGG
jgi:uncharacterized membrane protein (UPF0136 family)